MSDTESQGERFKAVREERDRAVYDLRIVQEKLEILNRRLEEAERGKSHFLSNIRKDDTPEGLERKRLALLIRREALDLDFEIRNVFAAAELEAGESAVTIARIQSGRLLADCFEGLAHKVDEKGVRILLSEVPPEEICQDPGKFSLIVANLLRNAVEYTRPASSVRVSLTAGDGMIRFTVSDEGEGIPPDRRARIFDRFAESDREPSCPHQGIGIGLSVVQALLSLMGGGLQVESEPGRGTRVRVWVPELSRDSLYESSWGNDVLILSEDPKASEEIF
ncbi:MAG: HAMP domain-containing histidine kinase [Nitrospirae bacterium]|nr:HAMP domain-containing histidine kinase [Nitrospirota bacterium]